jgi:hypothetical protein
MSASATGAKGAFEVAARVAQANSDESARRFLDPHPKRLNSPNSTAYSA